MSYKLQPWTSADATSSIRQMGQSSNLTLSYSIHFKERLSERDLLLGDVLHVLKHGFVYDEPKAATQPGLFRYRIETRTPNSGNRNVRLVVIPDPTRCWIKVVTVMWADEQA